MTLPPFDMNNPIKVLQHQMQQKLGSCMLRLQQYERLMKSMVAGTAIEGRLNNCNPTAPGGKPP